MKRLLLVLPFAFMALSISFSARAEKFGFCGDEVTSGAQCFMVMLQETYRKCRIVQSMMIIEYGFANSYLPDNNGEKLNACIEKHRKGIEIPYRAALKEVAMSKVALASLAGLRQKWMEDMQALIPALVENIDGYQTRVREIGDDLLANLGIAQPVLRNASMSVATRRANALPTRLSQK